MSQDAPQDTADKPRARPRHPTKNDTISVMRQIGVPIGTILDVGVLYATPELLFGFPGVHHVLMEPIIDYNEGIRQNYDKRNASYEIVNAAITDHDGEVILHTSSVYPGRPISHARIVSAVGERSGGDHRTVPAAKLDTIVAARDLKAPYLLKIDVDGAELQVLDGAKETLKDTSIVIIETGLDNMLERVTKVIEAGFQVFDIVGISYYNRRFVQADFVFIRRDLIAKHNLQPYRGGLKIELWENYNPS